MFWGVTLENGKRYSQVVDHAVHISMASLDASTDHSSDSSKPVTVMIDHEKSEFVLCTLIPGKIFQQRLDLQFAEGEEVTLFLNGQGIVHLTGYEEDNEPEEGDMDDSDDELSPSDLTDDQMQALIRARNKMGDPRNLKRKAIEQSPKGSVNKHLKRDSSGESDDDEDDDDDDDEDEDDESDDQERQPIDEDDDDDDEPDGYSSEDFSDDDLFVKTPATGKRGPNATPGKGLTPATFNKQTPPKQQQQQQQKQTPKNTPKPPTQSGQTPKGQQGKTPKGHPAQTPKGQPGQSPKKGAGQQNAPKPAANGNTSLNETESAKKRRKRQKKKKNDAGSPKSNVNSGSEKKPEPQKKQGSEKKPSKVNEATPSKERPKQALPGGVVIEDMETGNGPVAKAGKFVHVYYTGRLANGKEFDSTGDGKPFKFRLGNNEVIKGWDAGLQGMKVGGTRKITIPPSQGYGNKSIGKIPSNSTLIFDIRLAAVN